MKLISLIIIVCCLSCQNKTNIYREYLIKNSNFKDFELKKEIFIYKDPGCGGCNVKMKNYLDTVNDIENLNLIYLVKYPDQKTLTTWRNKYKNNLFVDKSDLLNQMNTEVIRSGKITLNNSSISFTLLAISDEINQFMQQ